MMAHRHVNVFIICLVLLLIGPELSLLKISSAKKMNKHPSHGCYGESCLPNPFPVRPTPLCALHCGPAGESLTCSELEFSVGYRRCISDTSYIKCVAASAKPKRKKTPKGTFCCDVSNGVIEVVSDLEDCDCAAFPTFIQSNTLLGGIAPVNLALNPSTPDIGLKGVAVLDCNNDGYDDIFYVGANVNNRGHFLFKNDGIGQFTDITVLAGLSTPSDHGSVLAVDLNNDGCTDLVLGGGANNLGPGFYQNDCDCTFSSFTATAHLPHPNARPAGFPSSSMTISAADYNNDGYVDLFFTYPGDILTRIFSDARIFINNGNMTFTEESRVALPFAVFASCVSSFHDFDHDGFVDLFVGVCNAPYVEDTPTFVFHNNGNGTFSDVSNDVGLGYANNKGFPMSFTLGDWNRDCTQDIFLVSSSDGFKIYSDHFFLIANNGHYEQHSSDIGITYIGPNMLAPFGWGSVMIDFDNDGWLDLAYVGNLLAFNELGNSGYVYKSVPCSGGKAKNCKIIKRQVSLRQSLGLDIEQPSGMAYGDFNNDGFVDLVISNVVNAGPANPFGATGELQLFMNSGVNCPIKHYIDVGLNGTISNAMGIGSNARVVLADGQSWVGVLSAESSFASSNSRYLHFGFQTSVTTAYIYVEWMGSGIVEWFMRAIDQKVLLTEETGTACDKFRER